MEGLLIKVLPLYAYAEAHAAFRRANKTELKAWRGNRMMERVEEYEFARVRNGH